MQTMRSSRVWRVCARKCIVFREEEKYLGDGPSFVGARREIMKVEQIICSQLFFDTFRDVAKSILHPAKTKEKKQRQDKALCFLSELYSLSDTPLAYRPGDNKKKVVIRNVIGSSLPLHTHLPQPLQRLPTRPRSFSTALLLQQQLC